MLIYFASIADGALVMAILGLIISVTVGIVSFVVLLDEDWDLKCGRNTKVKMIKKAYKVSLVMVLVCSIVFTFIPSKQDIYLMYATKLVTEENYNFTKEELKSGIDYLFEKIKEVEGK